MAASAPSDVLIVRMTEADLSAVDQLEAEVFSDPWSRQAFRSTLRSEASFAACARSRDGGLLGYVVAWFAGGEGEIANLAVATRNRGQGIGGRLLDAALEAGRERSTTTVYLEVRDSNLAALTLYRSRGFEQVGRRRAYYRKPVEDAVILRLDLARDT
jgi:ribosomal-protein-alanine acetyltransferase